MKLLAGLLLALLVCRGVDRWDVKTLQDGFEPGAPVKETIDGLIKLPAPKHWTRELPRQPLERTVVTVSCEITEVGIESDSDFHLVLSDGKHTMIGEIPEPECANQKFASPFQYARAWVVKRLPHYPEGIKKLAKPIPCTITGVIFFDKTHGQSGVAPNGIEAHPILMIR